MTSHEDEASLTEFNSILVLEYFCEWQCMPRHLKTGKSFMIINAC